jgi:hypothetical protein
LKTRRDTPHGYGHADNKKGIRPFPGGCLH